MPIKINRKGIITDRYLTYLNVMSAFNGIKLSDMEKTILDRFFWISNGKINTDSRKQVAKELKITNFNLTNGIGKIRKKGLLAGKKGTDEEVFIDRLLPDVEAGKKSFVIQLELIS